MSIRRIEDPHYGMVVTDGVAQRVFMLVTRSFPERGDDNFVWWTVRINWDGSVAEDMVYLAPGEWAEVIP